MRRARTPEEIARRDAAITQLRDGTDATVLDLARSRDADAAVRRAARSLGDADRLIVTAPAALNATRVAAMLDDEGARLPGATTRAALEAAIDAAGLDLVWVTLVPDRHVAERALPLDGALTTISAGRLSIAGSTAEEAEESSASDIVLCARRRQPGPEVSVVLPVRASRAAATRCVEAILAHPPSAPFEIVVADDANEEDLATGLGSHPSLRVIRVDEQVGYVRATAIAARAARGETLVLLHHDTLVHAGCIDELVATVRHDPLAGAAGARLLDHDGRIEHAGFALGPDLIPYPIYRQAPADAPHVLRPCTVPAVSFACAAVPRAAFARTGGLDARYAWNLHDGDACLRLRARGLTIHYRPAAVATHDAGGTPGPRTMLDDALAFLRRWREVARSDDDARAAGDGLDVWYQRVRGWHLPRPGRAPLHRPEEEAGVVWTANVFDRSGYANEARAFIFGLHNAKVDVYANPFRWPPPAVTLPEVQATSLWHMATAELPSRFLHVCHFPAIFFLRHPRAMANVGRTMFETDWLPADRVERCLQMDEIWVPSRFNVETFTAAGVPSELLHVVHPGIDVELFDPPPPPLEIEGAQGFVFLSVFVWSVRKGWDVLLRAYLDEFDRKEDVTLVVGVSPRPDSRTDFVQREFGGFVRDRLGRDIDGGPRVVFLALDNASPYQMARLYRAADAFVLPSRGEGWGMPYMEAMASGLPTIGTGWSGNTEFMTDDVSYPLEYELVDVPREGWAQAALFRGHRWAEPSVTHLRTLMRQVFEDQDAARETGARARSHIFSRFSQATAAGQVIARLHALAR